MTAVFKREFRSCFHNLTGFVFTAILLFFNGLFITADNLIYGYSEYEYVLSNLTLILGLAIPLITMRIFAEDKKNHTDKLLLSLPLTPWQIVLGKYFSLLAVFGVSVGTFLLSPLFLRFFGKVNFLSAYGAVFAFSLLASALIAICMFISSRTDNMIIAVIAGLLVTIAIYLVKPLTVFLPSTASASFICFAVLAALCALIAFLTSKNLWVTLVTGLVFLLPPLIIFIAKPTLLEGLFAKAVDYISIFARFDMFVCGAFDIGAAVLYVAISSLFVFLTVRSVSKPREAGKESRK